MIIAIALVARDGKLELRKRISREDREVGEGISNLRFLRGLRETSCLKVNVRACGRW
jgi:hypothetical protein